jgi:hypothetical protein
MIKIYLTFPRKCAKVVLEGNHVPVQFTHLAAVNQTSQGSQA